ncbi:MAG: hypothetical protein WCI55_12655 [Armatimonadota bacterium]
MRLHTSTLRICLGITSLLTASLSFGAQDWHAWTETFGGGFWNFNNTSTAGTISGSCPVGGFAGSPGPYGMPTAMTGTPFSSAELQINASTSLGATTTFLFSAGYAWGTGGDMLIGNIHNGYGYTISAWDFSNNLIDVNTWSTVTEFNALAPGCSGYFSTSSTSRSAVGLSSLFFVQDTAASPDLGQGGEVWVTGLQNVSRIDMTLSVSNLIPNSQQVDLMFFNVSTPTAVPEPLSGTVIAGFGLATLLRKKRILNKNSK